MLPFLFSPYSIVFNRQLKVIPEGKHWYILNDIRRLNLMNAFSFEIFLILCLGKIQDNSLNFKNLQQQKKEHFGSFSYLFPENYSTILIISHSPNSTLSSACLYLTICISPDFKSLISTLSLRPGFLSTRTGSFFASEDCCVFV